MLNLPQQMLNVRKVPEKSNHFTYFCKRHYRESYSKFYFHPVK